MKLFVVLLLVVGCGGSSSDGPACDPTACSAMGGSCTSDEVCVLSCPAGACGTIVRCPAGLRCEVDCLDPGSCANGVECGDAYSCAVACRGANSCANEIRCGAGPCIVTCSGDNSCSNGSTCTSSCACDVRCTGAGSCGDAAMCPAGCTDGPGCTPEDDCNICE